MLIVIFVFKMFYNFIVGWALYGCGFEEIFVPGEHVVFSEGGYLKFSLKTAHVEEEKSLVDRDSFKPFPTPVSESFPVNTGVVTAIVTN